MRIGLLAYGLDRPTVGITRYIRELAQALALSGSGHEVFLLSAGPADDLGNSTNLPIVQLYGCRLLPALMILGNFWLPILANRLQLDIIHDPTGVTPFLLGAGNARVVVTIHDVFAWSIPGYSSTLDRLIYRGWLPRILPRRSSAVITVSRQSQVDISKYLQVEKEKIRIIAYGINSRFTRISADQVHNHLKRRFNIEFPYILYVGALTQRKNIERAIRAFCSIHLEHPDLRFIIAGPQSWKQTPIETIVENFGIRDKLVITGPLTDNELPALYNGAELFVFPSLFEGFGLPPLEAMACGTPVVTSNTSSLPEVVGDAALLVDPYDVDAIATAMQRILAEPALAEDLRQRGLQRARQFTWEQTARQTMQVYQQVLSTP